MLLLEDRRFCIYALLDTRIIVDDGDSYYQMFYIGMGNEKRPYTHFPEAYNTKKNSYKLNLIRKIKRETGENPSVQILAKYLTWSEACKGERFWIKKKGRRDLGLGPLSNLCDGGEGTYGLIPWNKDRVKVYSEDTIRRMSESQKGERNHNYGKSMSEEQKRKIGKSNKGKKHSPESRKKISDSSRGKILSEEHKINISISNKNKIPWNKGIPAWNKGIKMSEKFCKSRRGENNPMYGKDPWNKGKKSGPLSYEHKKKVSESLKGKKKSEEHRKNIGESKRGEKNPNYGKPTWNKGKKGIQIPWNKGLKMSPEFCEKCSESHLGKVPWNKDIPQTEEAKRKNSEGHRGQIPWNKGKKTGPNSEEIRKKKRDGQKRRREREKGICNNVNS